MTYTVTFNPAIDYVIGVETLEQGMTNRALFEQFLPGGKGLNVSTVLTNLGIENIALGFIAGFTGEEIKRSFEACGCKSDFIVLKEGKSRINVKIKAAQETEINAAGPRIDEKSVSKLMNKLNLLKCGDILILAGSIPASMPPSLYGDIMKMLAERNVLIAVDATGALLLNVLPFRPFVVKPNSYELGELFDVTLFSKESVIPYAKKLQEKGARNVLVSMACEGAVLLAETGEVFLGDAPKGTVKNSVGAGDSMLAGFIAGWCQKHDYAYALKMALASGSASAFSQTLATKSEIENVYQSLSPITSFYSGHS